MKTKTHLSHLAAAFLLLTTAARAGTLSKVAWTNDASTGITAGQTAWAYHFGATTTAVVNGVSVTGIAGPTASNAHFELTGTTSVLTGDTNSLTALGGTGSAVIGNDFVYGGNPTTLTLKGLTVGQSYAVSLFTVGWITGQAREQAFESDADGIVVDPQQYGQDQGMRVEYVFVATAATRGITLTPLVGTNSFHLYGLALRQTTGAGSLVVSNGFDSGTGSMRQTLADAAVAGGADTLTFDAGLSGATLTLSSEIVINDTTGAVTVDATSLPGGVTIDGGTGTNRIFSVSSGKSLALLGLTLTGGNGGGAAQNGNGGAIVNFGTLALTRCTLSGNAASNGGALLNDGGNATLTQCTLSGNSTTTNGGAIYMENGTLMLTHCTLSGNSATDAGGGIGNLFFGQLTLANSIVAGNTASIGGADIYTDSTITPTGVNFIGDLVGSFLTASNTILTTAANGPINLAPLGNYGGPTQTMPPLVGSPAIDRAVGSSATTDQRGVAIAGVPDIGAVENGSRVTTTADQLDTPVGAAVSLREAVSDCPVGGVIDFAPSLSGQTATLTAALGGEIVVGKNVTIDASGLSAGLTIDGGAGTNRIFSVSSGKSLALLSLTLTGGNGSGAAQNGNGGAIVNFGTLALTRCTLSGNSIGSGSGGAILNDGGTTTLTQCTLSGNSTTSGGAILQTTGTLTLTQCTLFGNQASGDGGAIYNQTGALTLTHCTLSGNQASNQGGAFRNLSTSLTLANSLVAGNGATFGGSDIFSNSTPTVTGVNFIGTPAGSGLSAGPTIRTTAVNGPINLSPLGSNGGPTKTMVPRPGSPAIDVPSFIAGVTTDQRGFPRPVENGPIGELPDLGAVESQTVVVTTAADQLDTPTGPQTSLREALRDGADRVVFFPALAFQEVVLGSQLSVAKYVTIDASSIANGIIPSGMIVSANGVSRVFHIAPGVSADFIRLTITSGYAATNGFPNGYGGGAYVEGALTLTECTLQGNGAYVGAAAYVANSATASLTLHRCAVIGNGADYGGGIQNEGTLVCHSSTFAENVASVEGGAISAPFNKPVTLRHCTVSLNSAPTGGGTAGTAITLENSILSGNGGANGPDFSGGGALTGFNVVGTDALLAPLGDYGGPTKTMALKPGSPALNAATGSTITSDQRGFPIVSQRDSGAYEAGTFTNYNAWIWETLPAAATVPQHATTFDFDGDGQTNEKEWIARTDPGSAVSYFRVTQSAMSGSTFNATFPTVLGRAYQLQSSPNLANPWTNLGGATPGTGSPVTLPVVITGYERYFFRVSVGDP